MTHDDQITYIILFGLLMLAAFIIFASFAGMISVHQSSLDRALESWARKNQEAIAAANPGRPTRRVRSSQNLLRDLGAPLPNRTGKLPPSAVTDEDIDSFDSTFYQLISTLTGGAPFIQRFLEKRRASLYDAIIHTLSTSTIHPTNPFPDVRRVWWQVMRLKLGYGLLGGIAVVPGVVVNILRVGGGWLSALALLLAAVFLVEVAIRYVRSPQAEWDRLIDDIGVAITISSIMALPAAVLTLFGSAIIASYKKAHRYRDAGKLRLFLLSAPAVTLIMMCLEAAINFLPTLGRNGSDFVTLVVIILAIPILWSFHIFKRTKDSRYSREMQTGSLIGASVILALTAFVFWLYLDEVGNTITRSDALLSALWFILICSASTAPFFLLYHLAVEGVGPGDEPATQ